MLSIFLKFWDISAILKIGNLDGNELPNTTILSGAESTLYLNIFSGNKKSLILIKTIYLFKNMIWIYINRYARKQLKKC